VKPFVACSHHLSYEVVYNLKKHPLGHGKGRTYLGASTPVQKTEAEEYKPDRQQGFVILSSCSGYPFLLS